MFWPPPVIKSDKNRLLLSQLFHKTNESIIIHCNFIITWSTMLEKICTRMTRGDVPALAEGGYRVVTRVSMLPYPRTIHRDTILVEALPRVGDATDHHCSCYYELVMPKIRHHPLSFHGGTEC